MNCERPKSMHGDTINGVKGNVNGRVEVIAPHAGATVIINYHDRAPEAVKPPPASGYHQGREWCDVLLADIHSMAAGIETGDNELLALASTILRQRLDHLDAYLEPV